ncbi:hypothetical protein AQUCO_02100033v1 [Aquilegia coerulea]|uniref:Uncharacterized protein n=1 Tax=Aquilegia coerulea TaxID=218851 RepID=A0A2G5DEK1_AQUCA|nr:hypothetical protein AQUCO_02100033v1 [Aquilegia coerulea]
MMKMTLNGRAPLEKLPTYDRMRVSLLKQNKTKSEKFSNDQVEVRKLGLEIRSLWIDLSALQQQYSLWWVI